MEENRNGESEFHERIGEIMSITENKGPMVNTDPLLLTDQVDIILAEDNPVRYIDANDIKLVRDYIDGLRGNIVDDKFRKELEILINRYSLENGSGTPDFMLAQYLIDCLAAFDKAVKVRTLWYTRVEPMD